jgi:hypothetical protein
VNTLENAVRDILQGTVDPELPVPGHLRHDIRRRLRRYRLAQWSSGIAITLLVVAGAIALRPAKETSPNAFKSPPVDVHGTLTLAGGPPRPLGQAAYPNGLRGAVVFSNSDRSITVDTDDSGAFTTQIPSGTYEVVGHSPMYNGGRVACHTQHEHVEISSSSPPVDVYCLAK